MKKFYIYELKNNEKNLYYIGQKVYFTDKIKDNYLGSSQLMKYGGWHHGKYFNPFTKEELETFKKTILYKNLTKKEANIKEIKLIEYYRKKYGKENVLNQSDGGNGGFIGEEGYKKSSLRLKGRKFSEETKQKLSLGAKKRFSNPEEKQKLSDIRKKWWRDPKNKDIIEKTNKHKSEILKGRKIWDKRVHPCKGKPWWNNGQIEIHAFECPNGFKKGRLFDQTGEKNPMYNNPKAAEKANQTKKLKKENGWISPAKGRKYTEDRKQKMKWFNNGEKSIRNDTCPENYKPGRLYKRKTKQVGYE